MTILLTEQGVAEVRARVSGDDLWVTADEAANATGWELKPEGLCKGSVCIPVPPAQKEDFMVAEEVNLAAFWRHMDRPVLHASDGETWALGESADDRTAQLQSLDAPDFTLPDIDGKPHSLSDYRGKKVYLCSWASW